MNGIPLTTALPVKHSLVNRLATQRADSEPPSQRDEGAAHNLSKLPNHLSETLLPRGIQKLVLRQPSARSPLSQNSSLHAGAPRPTR